MKDFLWFPTGLICLAVMNFVLQSVLEKYIFFEPIWSNCAKAAASFNDGKDDMVSKIGITVQSMTYGTKIFLFVKSCMLRLSQAALVGLMAYCASTQLLKGNSSFSPSFPLFFPL